MPSEVRAATTGELAASGRYLARSVSVDDEVTVTEADPSIGVDGGVCLSAGSIGTVPLCVRLGGQVELWTRTRQVWFVAPASVVHLDVYRALRAETRVSARYGGATRGASVSIEAGVGLVTALVVEGPSLLPAVSVRPAVQVSGDGAVGLLVAVDARYAGPGDVGGTGIALVVGAAWRGRAP